MDRQTTLIDNYTNLARHPATWIVLMCAFVSFAGFVGIQVAVKEGLVPAEAAIWLQQLAVALLAFTLAVAALALVCFLVASWVGWWIFGVLSAPNFHRSATVAPPLFPLFSPPRARLA